MLLVGLMSGTSVDGIDGALVEIVDEIQRPKVRVISCRCIPFDNALRSAILDLCKPGGGSSMEICALDAVLGEKFADAVTQVCRIAGLAPSDLDAVACHGQTIWHQPEPVNVGGERARGTLQIGNPSVIAARVGCKVVSGFRSADMAAGGQGAPLVPFADWLMFSCAEETRVVQNIGGIANLTYLAAGGSLTDVIAFDTGPGNMVIDSVVSELTSGEHNYDDGGKWAANGNVDAALLRAMLEHPYFSVAPPKSTGRELFGEQYVQDLIKSARALALCDADIVATATALTAESIARSYADWLPEDNPPATVILGGGGVHNATLRRMLAETLAPARITTHEEFGIPDEAKEAVAFAVLGHETLHGRPSNVPSATGASRPVVLGSITPGPIL